MCPRNLDQQRSGHSSFEPFSPPSIQRPSLVGRTHISVQCPAQERERGTSTAAAATTTWKCPLNRVSPSPDKRKGGAGESPSSDPQSGAHHLARRRRRSYSRVWTKPLSLGKTNVQTPKRGFLGLVRRTPVIKEENFPFAACSVAIVTSEEAASLFELDGWALGKEEELTKRTLLLYTSMTIAALWFIRLLDVLLKAMLSSTFPVRPVFFLPPIPLPKWYFSTRLGNSECQSHSLTFSCGCQTKRRSEPRNYLSRRQSFLPDVFAKKLKGKPAWYGR